MLGPKLMDGWVTTRDREKELQDPIVLHPASVI